MLVFQNYFRIESICMRIEESSQVNGHEGSGRATPTLKNTELFRKLIQENG